MKTNANEDTSEEFGGKRLLVDVNKAREEKRRKWELKQARKQEIQQKETSRISWVKQNEQFASWVTEVEAETIHHRGTLPPRIEILLAPYVDIQDSSKATKSVVGKQDCDERLFVAEGTETIRLLIQQTSEERGNGLRPIMLKSIFVKQSILFEDPVNLLLDVMNVKNTRMVNGEDGSHPGFHVLVGSEAALSKVAGFQISRGALACGVIPNDCDQTWLEGLIGSRMCEQGSKKLRLLALDGICDTANLGSMIRCASAFGIDAIVLSKDTCEAWYRKSIRTSMGHIFRVPVVRVDNLSHTIQTWQFSYTGLHSFAAVIDTDCLLHSRQRGEVPSSWCCVMGNEGNGISKAVADVCTQRIRIDMERHVDSLSVPIACGILLHGLRERERNLC